MIEKVKTTIKLNKLFKQGESVLVCVSGGPDSVFLLDVLNKIKDQYGLKLFIAHLNHCLRAKESDADEAFVAKLALTAGVGFFRARVDVAKLAGENKVSIEQAARFSRYNFFANICEINKIKKIVLAHTKDDQAETILMRILRGTGIKGLGGMQPLSEWGDMFLVRPLLSIEKNQIFAYLKQNKINSRIDSSNLEKNYFRNKIRLDILPMLEQVSPALKDNLLRLADNAQKTEDFLQAKINPVYRKAVTCKNKDEILLEKNRFLKLMPIIRSGLIRKIVFNLNGDINGIDHKHISIIDDFIAQGGLNNKALDLPRSIQVIKAGQYIKFLRKRTKEIKKPEKKKYYLELGKQLKVKELGYLFKAESARLRKSVGLEAKPKTVEYLDFDKVRFPLSIRTRMNGDRFKPLGSGGNKKIKDFFIDQKIDRQEKEKIPLLLSGNKIALIAGMRISDDFKITKQTKHVLKITIIKIKQDSK